MENSASPEEQMAQVSAYFEAENPQFVAALREVSDAERLAQFADRWRQDPREWARQQQMAYLRMPADCVGHQPVVKRLFKQAEENRDEEIMAVCAALFDRLVRHKVSTRYRYDWQTRSSWREEYLAATAPQLTAGQAREGINPFTGEKMTFPAPLPREDALYFSYRTRYYLQRRVWRYFRRPMQWGRGADRYLRAADLILREYRDEDFDRGERILDCWTLLQLAFREHPALSFGRERVRLAKGGRLDDLRAAPRFPEVWRREEAFGLLLGLMRDAPSRLVRVWAMQVVEDHHAERVAQLPVETILDLLLSSNEDISTFAAGMLRESTKFGDLPVEKWMQILDGAPPVSVGAVCEAIERHVSPASVTLEDCIDLAMSEPTPVAQLGVNWLKERELNTEAELDQVAQLADAKCAVLAGQLAQWALGLFESKETYDRDAVSRFFDSLSVEVRKQAWAWLERPGCPGADDPVLFCRLLETPFDDLRLRLVDLLEQRSLPGEARGSLVPVWTTVLLGVHRGGRQKLKAVRQLADELIAHPEQADNYLPVLAVAVRSVRRPESQFGLAAVVGSLAAEPALADAVATHLPELEIVPPETAAAEAAG